MSGLSLNQSITAAWGTQPAASTSAAGAATKKRVRKTVAGLNSPASPGPDGTSTAPASEPETAVRKKRVKREQREGREDKYAPPDARLNQLGGLGKQVTQLMEIVALPLLHPEIYAHTGVPRPRGVLLHGVPGGGKTQLVRCLAGVSGAGAAGVLTTRN